VGVDDLVERVAPVVDRCDPTRFNELPHPVEPPGVQLQGAIVDGELVPDAP
jgi:hypothetical protein